MTSYDKKPQIGWSNYEASLRRFDIFYYKAQNLFSATRNNHALLPLLYDTINEVYRMEYPYFNKKGKDGEDSQLEIFTQKRARLQSEMNNYFRNNESFKRNNFGNMYNALDNFFLDLTMAGAELNFLPPVVMPRDIQDKIKAVGQI